MNRTATQQPVTDRRSLGADDIPGAITPPPKLRRRPALMAAAIAAVCLGALVAGWAWTSTTSTQNVLAARNSIERGSTISAEDLVRVRVGTDPAITPVSASEFDQIVGQRATFDIAEGALLTPTSLGESVMPPSGRSIVGLALAPERGPGLDLQNGDRVRVVVTPPPGEPISGTPVFHDAEVAGVRVSDETGQVVVDLLMPHADAPLVAAQAASGQVALVLDSRER